MVPGTATAPRVPTGARLGAITIAFGLLLDVAEHGFAVSGAGSVGGRPIGEHVAHLVVLVGMVLVLAAIVRDGARSRGRRPQGKGSVHDAIR